METRKNDTYQNDERAGITRRDILKMGGVAIVGGIGLSALSACAADQKPSQAAMREVSFSKPGTYSSVANGRNGKLTLTVTTSANAIEKILYESVESRSIGGQAMDLLTEDVLTNQTVAVDTITGATFTTVAYVKALQDCLEQAGGDLFELSTRPSAEKLEYVTEADVIVVGIGGAGMTAALTAAQEGASVIALEKSNMLGGNTNAAISGINVVNSAIQKSSDSTATIASFKEMQMNNDLVREALVDSLTNNSGETADWLASLGIPFIMNKDKDFQLLAESEHSVTTNTVISVLNEKIAEASNINLYKNMEATSILTDEQGNATGIVAKNKEGEEISFSGKSIVLTSGGHGKNHDLMVLHSPASKNALTDEISPTTGDGLYMASRIGAALVDLNQVMINTHYIPVYGMMVSTTIPGGRRTPKGIIVNKSAVRIPEETTYDVKEVLAHEDGALFHIFPASETNAVVDAMLGTGYAFQTNTPEELATSMGLNPQTLKKTITDWNTCVANGVDDLYGRTDSGMVALDGAIIGYEFHGAVHYCMGGILIDENAQVVNSNSKVIGGLYAAGEATGGVHGTTRLDGSALADTFVFGRTVGKSAAKAALA
jgi:flavocytochrome c